MSNQRENPTDFRTRCLRNEAYCRENIEDRSSRNNIAREVWYEKFFWLKKNAWWTFRNLQHWILDYDYLHRLTFFEDPENEWFFTPNHRPHRGGGGHQDDSLRLDAPKAHPERKEATEFIPE